MQAGWYSDPSGSFEHRYWDGAQWTSHVASQGVSDTSVTAAEWPDPSDSSVAAVADGPEGTSSNDLSFSTSVAGPTPRPPEDGVRMSDPGAGTGSFAEILRPFVGQHIGINWAAPNQLSPAELVEVTDAYIVADALTDPSRGAELPSHKRPRLVYPCTSVLSACLGSQALKNPHVFGKNPSVAMTVVVQHPPSSGGSGLMVGAIF